MSIIEDLQAALQAAQRRYNEQQSVRLLHASLHRLAGRRYRRGKNRCKVCGGFLK